MKSRNGLINALYLLVLALLVLSSAQGKDEPAELKGEEVKIIDIIQDAAAFEGLNVVVEGIIETECPSGC
ncbi:MAG: hypothetical protein LUQ44_00865, partial [Methanothrix sp.]|nr:hypothetical protein [Methanothrix sp.]MDD1759136.1 hypothetical protein [Methanothrix sp.]